MKLSLKSKLLTTSIIIFTAQTAAMATPVLDRAKNPGISSINNVGLTTTVNQNAARARVRWKTIDTAPNEVLEFKQPSKNSIVINDVTNGQATLFQGTLNANGKVVIRNEAGMTFTKGSQINVNSLIATNAKSITSYGDTNEKYKGDIKVRTPKTFTLFSGYSDKPINIDGTINAQPGGYVKVLGREVNVGSSAVINADQGGIGIHAGNTKYAIDMSNGAIAGSRSRYKTGVINQNGTLQAKSGYVTIGANSSDKLSGALNMNGIVDVISFTGGAKVAAPGRVRLVATGDANINGTINASGDNGAPGKGNVYVRAYNNLAMNADVNTASTKGYNRVNISSGKNMVLKGKYDATGTKTSAINITSGGNTDISAGIQVGAGKAKITSAGTTALAGYIDAQGDNANALPSKVPTPNGGSIYVNSRKDFVANGFVVAGSLQGVAGTVNLVSGGNLTTNTKIAGKTVNLRAAKNLDIQSTDGKQYITAYSGGYDTGPAIGNNITLTSGGETKVDALLAAGNIKGGGKIKVTSRGNATINGGINNSSSQGNGGTVTITSSKALVSKGDIDTSAALKGGNVAFRAKTFTEDPDAVYTTFGTVLNGTVKLNNKSL